MSIWGNVILPQKDGFIYGANEPGVPCLWFNTVGSEIPADPDVSHGMLLYRDSDGVLHPLYPMTTIAAVYGLDNRLENMAKENKGYVDVAKAEANAYTDASVRKAAPRNLLDNSDFRNPVNQRGVTTTNDWAYCIDRWISRRTGMSLQNTRDGLTITSANTDSYIYQRISNPEKLLGKKCTAAVCEGNGNITITSFTFPDSIPTDWTAIADNTEGNIRLYIFGINDLSVGVGLNDTVNEVTIKWVALYEGEYTAETLPEYQPKGYGAELLECQRYYYRRNLLCVLHLVNKSNLSEYRGEITFPVEMRTNPQCAFDQNEGNVAIGLVNNQLCLLTGTPNELGWCTTGSRLEFIADL